MTSALTGLAHDTLNLFFPNNCIFCGRELERGTCICRECLSTIEIIGGRTCDRCGAPVAGIALEGKGAVGVQSGDRGQRAGAKPRGGANGQEAGCPQCADLDFRFRRNESLGVYRGKLRELIHLFKFQKRRSLYTLFSELLVRSKRAFIVGHDVLVSVPLTRERILERGYNQSFLVARDIAAKLSLEFFGEAMVRKGNARPQSSVPTRKERLTNITDNIFLKGNVRNRVAGKTVVLFDDVFTTGATASECARALLNEGARAVDLLTIARALVEP